MADRLPTHERGYDWRWKKARILFLQQHPLCAYCLKLGRVQPAQVVDHIIPARGDMVRFWMHENWQALCKRCHDVKTATEDGAFGRAPSAPRIAIGVDGWPVGEAS